MPTPLCYAPCETHPGETRCALTPESAAALVKLGFAVRFEPGLGRGAGHLDEAYFAAGAQAGDGDTLAAADLVLRIRKPSADSIGKMKPGAVHLSLLDPFNERALIERFAAAGVAAVSLELVPRTTLAQKMDVLSSQASLAGYAAVVHAAARLPLALPMMMTPAGTLLPAKVFVIGAGVAGLQAIATAKRLGARVEAFDTRPVVEEQVRSLGAKFLKIDLGQTGQSAGGYAQALTPEQIARQQAGMAKACAQADIVVTTAKLFGRKSPILLTPEMVAGMRAGSVIADLALEAGGNTAGAEPGRDVLTPNGVLILGEACYERHVARHASQVFAANLLAWVTHFWDGAAARLALDRTGDEILAGSLVTRDGRIVHPTFAPKAA
jgi:NAD(P) transhydrogenase subunit alpha